MPDTASKVKEIDNVVTTTRIITAGFIRYEYLVGQGFLLEALATIKTLKQGIQTQSSLIEQLTETDYLIYAGNPSAINSLNELGQGLHTFEQELNKQAATITTFMEAGYEIEYLRACCMRVDYTVFGPVEKAEVKAYKNDLTFPQHAGNDEVFMFYCSVARMKLPFSSKGN